MQTAMHAMRLLGEQLPPRGDRALLLDRLRRDAAEVRFLLDDGEVETIAHYEAAAFFDPDVTAFSISAGRI